MGEMGDWAGDWAGDGTVVGVEVGAEERVSLYEEIVALASRRSWRKRKRRRRWMWDDLAIQKW